MARPAVPVIGRDVLRSRGGRTGRRTSMGNPEPRRPYDILMVEDSPTDVLLTRAALAENPAVPLQLHVASDGEEGLAFLRRQGKYAQAPRPDLVLLDLNLPRIDGHEVLATVKTDEELKTIPVVVLTTSKADEDVLRAYTLHANCYLTKPVDYAQFAQVVRSLEHYWFQVATLPPEARP